MGGMSKMRIDRKKKIDAFKTGFSAGSQEVKRAAGSAFDQELTQQKQTESQTLMGAILKEVDRISERLKNTLSIHDLMQYKRLVKDFLKEASNHAYLLKQDMGSGRRGRTILMTVKVVDKEIEELLTDFMKQRKGPLEILAEIDKIRGMLLDLMI